MGLIIFGCYVRWPVCRVWFWFAQDVGLVILVLFANWHMFVLYRADALPYIYRGGAVRFLFSLVALAMYFPWLSGRPGRIMLWRDLKVFVWDGLAFGISPRNSLL